MSEPKVPALAVLASSCVEAAKVVDAFLYEKGIEASDTLQRFPRGHESVEKARAILRESSRALFELASGPEQILMETSLNSVNACC